MNAWGDLPLKQLSSAVVSKHGDHPPPAPEALSDEGANEILLDGELPEPGPGSQPFPARADLYQAIKDVLSEGPTSSAEIAEQLADRFELTLAARQWKLSSGVPAWRNHVAWALVDLGGNARGSGEIEGTPASYRLTST